MDNVILLKIMFLGMGGIIVVSFFIAGLYYLNKNLKQKKYTCKTYGKIINNIGRQERFGADRQRDYRTRWYSLCEYTVGETKCVRETNVGTLQPREIGTVVTIYYNPDNCHESYIEGDNNSGVKAIIALILGIILIFFVFIIIKSFS